MSEGLYQEAEQTLPPQRSTFLTVLCVLTFLGSAYGIFAGLSSVITAEKVVTEMKKANSQAEQEKAKQELQKKKDNPGAQFGIKMMDSVNDITVAKLKQSGVASALTSVLTLAGALLMWRLNRKGFYLYVAGTIAAVIIPFAVFGSSSIIAIMGAVIPGFFGVVFIAMYAFNLKDMR